MTVIAGLLFAALYLLLSGQPSIAECAAALLLGIATAAFQHRLARLAAHPLALRLPWLRLLRAGAASLAGETARITLALLPWRLLGPGRVIPQPFEPGGDSAAERTRRGAVQLTLSLAPNGFVLAPVPGSDSLPVHRLDPGQPASPERVWPP